MSDNKIVPMLWSVRLERFVAALGLTLLGLGCDAHEAARDGSASLVAPEVVVDWAFNDGSVAHEDASAAFASDGTGESKLDVVAGDSTLDVGSGEAGPSEPESESAPEFDCVAGATETCFEGLAEHRGVGRCQDGVRRCVDGLWGACEGQQLARIEALGAEPGACTNGLDDDCDGLIDEDTDEDFDGFGGCSVDCCDSQAQWCGAKAPKINPGALEIPGNGIDDDCDGVVDGSADAVCSGESLTDGVTADDLVRAMDLCRFVSEDELGWGVLEASLSLADGSGAPAELQRGVTERFGGLLAPVGQATMAVLSTGIARGVGEPGFQDTNTHNAGTKSAPPARYMSVHDTLQTRVGCAAGNATVRDSVRLRLRLRAPTNVTGLSYRFRFFSHEYPNYLCTKYNDFFLVIMDSAAPGIPDDGNISFDTSGNPISVNNAFFTSCEPLSCYDSSVYPLQSGPDADHDGCVDVLTCNGDSNQCEGDFGACPDGSEALAAFTTDLDYAGATAWLTTEVPVVPGEELTLDFVIWDTSDAALDSSVLIDDFQWIAQSGSVGLTTHR